MKLNLVYLLLFLYTSLYLLLTQNVFACWPSGPDPWFNEDISFDEATIPDGIEVVPKVTTWVDQRQSNGVIHRVQKDSIDWPYGIINKNLEPFYLVREKREGVSFENSEIPDNFEPLFKITSDRVYYYVSPQSPTAWREYIRDGNTTPPMVGLEGNMYLLEGKSKQIYRDNRPEVVNIPSPQNFKILGIFRDNLIEIKGTITYSLNEKYDPKSLENGCSRMGTISLVENFVFGLVALVLGNLVGFLVLGIGFLVYLTVKRFKK